jgi:hypothetical protein
MSAVKVSELKFYKNSTSVMRHYLKYRQVFIIISNREKIMNTEF